MKPKYNRLLGLTTVIALSQTATLMAADYTWTGATSNVSNVNTNWNPNGTPGFADNILIDTSTPNPTNIPSGNWDRRGTGTTTITNGGIVNVVTGSARFLNSGGAFNLSGGQLNHNGEYFIVGNSANSATTGVFNQSGGTMTSSHIRGFFLSDGAAATGTSYILSGGTMNVTTTGAYSPTVAGERRLRSVWFGKGNENTVAADITGDTFKVTGGTASFARLETGGPADLLISRNSSLIVEGGTASFDKYTEVRIGHGFGGTDNSGTTASGANNSNITVSGGVLNITGNSNVRVGYADAGTIRIGGTGAVNLTGNLNVGTGGSKGTLAMTGGTLTVTNTGVDTIGGGNNGNATVALSGTSVLNAGTTKWKTGDFGGNGNAGGTTISLSDSASLTLKEFTIGHLGGAAATETVTLTGASSLTVNNFITMGRDDNAASSGIISSLNLNGGTLSTKYIIKGGDYSDATRNFISADGGTIKALAAEPDFFRNSTLTAGRVYVNLQAGGLKFDTNGFDVGIQNGLHGTGGLTKLGAGTLSLSSDSDYTGTTTVSAGTLQVATGNHLFDDPAPAVMADGTTLSVKGDIYQSWKASDLTLGTSTGVNLEILNFDPLGGTAAISATGNLVTRGTIPIKIIGTPTVGTFPLINYAGSLTGSGFGAFQLTTLPRGVEATLTHANKVISLNVTKLNLLKWKGNVNSTWDINTTSNWTLGTPAAKYLENDNVRFDETGTVTTTVNLNATVAPASVVVENTTKAYTIGGTGSITGATTLTKLGAGMLTLATANTYTGNTTVTGGTLRFGDGVTDGSITGPLVVSDTNVIFNTTGTSTLPGNIDAAFGMNTFTKTGAGTQILTGTTNTYFGLFQIDQGTLQIGNGTVNGSIGSFGSISYGIASGAQLRLNYGTVPLTATPWSAISGAGTLSLGITPQYEWGSLELPSGFTGTLKVEKGRLNTNSLSYPGSLGLGGTTKVQILSGAQFLAFASEAPYTVPIEIAGGGWGENGYPGGLRLAGDRTATWAGSVTLTADSGIMTQRNSNFTVTGSISGAYQCEFYAGDPVGDSGVLNIAPATGRNSYASTRINGRAGGSTVAGNANAFSTGPLVVAESMLKLNGFNFTFANLSGTGGKIGNYHAADSAVITVGGDNTSTTYAGVILDGGTAPLGITKTGTGTLTLSGANAYTGATTVSQGTLSVTSPTLGDNSTVSIASGAHLDLATGTAADTIGVLVLGGVTMPPGTYGSTHPVYGSYFTGTGSVVIAGGYSSWATSKGLDATNNGATQDPDNDGFSNLLEFYLDGNPLASDGPALLSQTTDDNYLSISFHRRDDANGDITSQSAQFGSDLSGWTDAPITAASSGPDANGVLVDIAGNGTAPDSVTVRIPTTKAIGRKLFVRLKIVK